MDEFNECFAGELDVYASGSKSIIPEPMHIALKLAEAGLSRVPRFRMFAINLTRAREVPNPLVAVQLQLEHVQELPRSIYHLRLFHRICPKFLFNSASSSVLVELFHDVVAIDVNQLVEQHPENLLSKALTNHLAIPRWKRFTSEIKGIFRKIRKSVKGGTNAQYIPVLAEADPSKFAVSVCTVDGQMYSVGDYNWGFSIQSCVKPLLYAMALQENGLKRVHRHVGHEASGLAFNEVSLNKDELPYNPMVNSGAIATASTVRA